jgi:hypothetical protein
MVYLKLFDVSKDQLFFVYLNLIDLYHVIYFYYVNFIFVLHNINLLIIHLL